MKPVTQEISDPILRSELTKIKIAISRTIDELKDIVDLFEQQSDKIDQLEIKFRGLRDVVHETMHLNTHLNRGGVRR